MILRRIKMHDAIHKTARAHTHGVVRIFRGIYSARKARRCALVCLRRDEKTLSSSLSVCGCVALSTHNFLHKIFPLERQDITHVFSLELSFLLLFDAFCVLLLLPRGRFRKNQSRCSFLSSKSFSKRERL